MTSYGGDEVSAIVIDLGSHSCKAGYAGEDAPKAVFPSVVGAVGEKPTAYHVGNQSIQYRRDNMEVLPALRDGLIADWDITENIWDHAFKQRLLIDPKEHPMMLAEPSYNTQQHREKTVSLMFEKYGVPAVFLAKNAVLTSFASGRATSLVVDCGGGSTTVAAVHDGFVLQKAIVRSSIGGDVLTECLLRILESKKVKIKPRFSFKKKELANKEFEVVDLDFPNTTDSYYKYMQRVITADIKETVCRVPDSFFDETQYANMPTTPYELPDGNTIEVGAERFKVPELMFNPALIQTVPGMEKYGVDLGHTLRGLPQMVNESINRCDVDIRRELYSSILLAGGTTSMQQLRERLEKDLMESARVKVLGSGNAIERRFSTWIGGSILASLGSFQQMWFSKAEYEEHGPSYVLRKCP